MIDNLREKLDSAAVASALTTEVWTDRRLGHTEIVKLPNRATWIATGNNVALSDEITRRCVRIRLDARIERPEDRTQFKHPRLEAWARDNRGDLVWAALTLARAWIAQGRPAGDRSVGSFEGWSAVMGGILRVAGVPGFLGNLDQLRESSGGEHQEFHAFLAQWRKLRGGAPTVVADLPPTVAELIGVDTRRDNWATQLGRVLGRSHDRQYGDLVLRRHGTRGGRALWAVEAADPKEAGGG